MNPTRHVLAGVVVLDVSARSVLPSERAAFLSGASESIFAHPY